MFCARNCVAISSVTSAPDEAVCCGQFAWLNGAVGQFVELNTPGDSSIPTTPGAGDGVPKIVVSAVSHTPGMRQLS